MHGKMVVSVRIKVLELLLAAGVQEISFAYQGLYIHLPAVSIVKGLIVSALIENACITNFDIDEYKIT